ncbi:unnamed protein product [Bursaphelenchus okinawaensis]|uniref:Trafficking protein particle complex subunit n=1 Tax=Bursaphelenchus okinawaensis TaxID=465554 RepID=A0A811LS17_9BILA|nr:unnamed protein product [Bursaphelenchus okinawaensis]CAG9127315.1 unnamed protein product [Bursaphelenchus okinawaensis]
MGSIYYIFVINRAGSLIYDYENHENEDKVIERSFTWPTGIVIELIDQKPTVVFGERDGVRIRYWVNSVNGRAIKNNRFTDEDGVEKNFIDYISDEKNFPVRLSFSPPALTANEKIILSSMFHSLYTIASQLSPVAKSSGIETLETSQFRLNCFQTMTGVKFIVVSSPIIDRPVNKLLRRVYELYSDFALKNPFYSIDMPIRADKFNEAIKQTVQQHERQPGVQNV